jgi:hypothetical protein
MEAVLRGVAKGILIRWIIRLFLFLVLPLVGIWYGFWTEHITVLIAGSVIAGMYLLWSTYVTVRSEIMRMAGRQPPKTILQSKIEIWDLMHNAYRMLGGPVVDPTRALMALDAAAQKGAVWDGAVYEVLNRVIARDPTACVGHRRLALIPRARGTRRRGIIDMLVSREGNTTSLPLSYGKKGCRRNSPVSQVECASRHGSRTAAGSLEL